ncbi:hypothetical protein BD311DRAFT_537060 [Dichomitus squalens]|uniref:Uncharacterized protein n=1 Tax=Dichomitus squalens TaxID=114155 RepID=A0A4V2JZE4_9APHY|nr:hypothetical protein BD311DRAFT_537060 [Dichomitus squalens]
MQLGRMCRHSPSLLVPAVRLEIRDHGAMIFLLGTGGSCSDSESPSALGAVRTSVATLTSSVARMMSRTTSAGLRFSCITFTIAVSLIAANRLQISVLYDSWGQVQMVASVLPRTPCIRVSSSPCSHQMSHVEFVTGIANREAVRVSFTRMGSMNAVRAVATL